MLIRGAKTERCVRRGRNERERERGGMLLVFRGDKEGGKGGKKERRGGSDDKG